MPKDRNLNKPDKVILHCAATDDSVESKVSVDEVRRWHVQDNGWLDIGYHWYQTRDGIWHAGRSEEMTGAHSGAVGNLNSLGLCYEGTWLPTEKQIEGLWSMYCSLQSRYGINYENWFAHYQYKKSKTCPGFSIDLLRAYFKAMETNQKTKDMK